MIINVIHDPERTDRGLLLAREIAKHSLHVEFHPAVKDDIASAHKAVVQKAKDKGFKSVLVAEDDFLLMDGGFDYFKSKIPKTFDIFLGGVYNDFGALPNEGSIVKRFSGFHFYLVHSRFYDLFLSADCSNQSLENALGQMALNGFGKFVCCYPYIAVQHESVKSTNALHPNMRFSHSIYFKKGDLYNQE